MGEPLGHDIKVTVVAGTETTKAHTLHYCTRCGSTLTPGPELPPDPDKPVVGYSLRGNFEVEEERILISTETKEYRYVYTGGNLMQMVITTTATPVDGEPTTTTETLNFT